jgi:Rps23 Pro-64 3,4-dihydroxylase Tpa1-like proline 4-hydroxylase
MKEIFNPVVFDPETIKRFSDQFARAKPYKHLVIENFLAEDFANTIHDNFPPLDQLSKHYHGLNEFKSEGSDFAKFHPFFSNLREALNTEAFCKVMEQISGIKNIYSTDDSLGAGVHQGKNGSYLDVHIDFNIHVKRNIHRRLNLLIFLNKNWHDSYGGKLEMWNENVTECVQSYLPSFNRCVIFETNDISYHGYSTINVPDSVTRKSFFCYFYTDVNENASRYHDTIFKARPNEGAMKKIKTDVKEKLKNNIKYVLKTFGISI